jgi:release factor glutamine methyltransferase
MNPIFFYIKDKLKDLYQERELSSIIKIILTDIFSMSTIEIYGDKDKIFSSKEMAELDVIIERLKKNEPIQYILGYEIFYGLKYKVTENVLIPRPETAELVEWIISYSEGKSGKIIDIGTGSGCIAISLAANIPGVSVEGWDISQEALNVASYNAKLNNVDVTFRNVDILSFSSDGEKYDVIVSNPPYITEAEKDDMQSNVLEWEPFTALFVNNSDPLLFYRKIAQVGIDSLLPDGSIYFEINRSFFKEIVAMLEEYGYRDIEVRKDCFGNERMVKARL